MPTALKKNRVNIKIICLFLIFSISLPSQAQTDSTIKIKKSIWTHASIETMYQNGYVFATNDFLRGNNVEAEKINAFQAFSLKYSKQTTGKHQWEQKFNYPNWGIGIYIADFYNPEEIGNPIALFGYFNAPFIRWDKLSFNYEIGFGATFNWKSFNPISNQYNVAIGAGESFLIDAGLNLSYPIFKHFDLIAGFSFTHFSNGAIKKPNYGINTLAPKLSLKYNIDQNISFEQHSYPKFKPEDEFLISVFGGVKNVVYDSLNIDLAEKYEGIFFGVFGISATYNKQISFKSKIGLGMTFSYDGSLDAQLAIEDGDLEQVNGPIGNKLQVSIYPSYELVVNKLSLILQPAFYLYRKKLKNQSPTFHQRIGLKYHFTKNLFIGITLRDYAFHVSDYIEWNVGYRIKWIDINR
jgi:hypothetical protein